MTRMKRIRLDIVMTIAHWLGVPVTPHQRYFAGSSSKFS